MVLNKQSESLAHGKALIEELYQLYVNLPMNSDYKKQIAAVISKIKNNYPLKTILLDIQSTVEHIKSPSDDNPTKRESDAQFWNYVLTIFKIHLPSTKNTP